MIILENEFLRAVIAPKGAELQSLLHKDTGIEHIWSGDTAYWGKHSPVLFPIVGTLKNDTYIYRDKSYTLPRHGFAREKIFTTEIIHPTEVLLSLVPDEQTLAVYPFDFIIRLRYRLHNHTLSCSYEIENPGSDELLFSVGAHPAFAVPFINDTNYTDYYLQFNVAEPLERFKLQDGLLTNITELLTTPQNRLPLHPSLFYEDAIVLKNMQSNQITLGCNNQPHGIHFSFNDFPFFGIWAAKDAPFVCLEPWCGIADSGVHNQQLQNKEGIHQLPPGAQWQRTWRVECF
jgi:galactose mutarotase-like enzyme